MFTFLVMRNDPKAILITMQVACAHYWLCLWQQPIQLIAQSTCHQRFTWSWSAVFFSVPIFAYVSVCCSFTLFSLSCDCQCLYKIAEPPCWHAQELVFSKYVLSKRSNKTKTSNEGFRYKMLLLKKKKNHSWPDEYWSYEVHMICVCV